MARPRKDQEGPTAQQRLEGAFWGMLAEGPFRDITVSAVCSRAGVNHNTFYYYFDGMEDMARRLFERNMLPQMVEATLPLLLSGAADVDAIARDAEVAAHFRRAALFASSGSEVLASILRSSLVDLWLGAVGLGADELGQAERDRLSFIFGGLVAALGDMGRDASPRRVGEIVRSPLGRGVFETLADLASGPRTSGTGAKPDEPVKPSV